MKLPLISIIVPNYNHERFLKKRIESILNQTFQNFEIILLDDASTDSSLKYLTTYKSHPKVSHFVVNEQNTGSPFKQWIRGVELSKGRYIWIAESDDYAELNFLEETIAAIQKDKYLNLVYTDSKIIDKDNNELGFWKTNKNSYFNTTLWSNNYTRDGIEDVFNYLIFKTTINNASAVLFKKSALIRNIDFNKLKKYRNVGDLYLYSNILLNGKIGYISKSLNNYRDHDENLTKKNEKNGILYVERFSFLRDLLDRIHVNKLDKKQHKQLKKAAGKFIKKNAFTVIDLKNENELFLLLNQLRRINIITTGNYIYLIVLFFIYALPFKKGKSKMRNWIKLKIKLSA
jgi:glycosyltransferase involved in cell wall biosynthesis